MPDIFLSYNREDQARAKLFAEAFEAQGFTYPQMSRVVLLQALGRTAEVQEAMRKARKVTHGEGLDFWVSLARNSYFSEAAIESYSQHFIEAWNATPLDPGT